jgi:hypothetical protein
MEEVDLALKSAGIYVRVREWRCTVSAIFRCVTRILICGLPLTGPHAQEITVLESYTCQEFLDDTKASDDDARWSRSLMMVAWAAGYAVGRNDGEPRTDPNSIRLIAETLSDVCRKMPDQKVVQAVTGAIGQFVASVHNRSAPPDHAKLPESDSEPGFVTFDSADIYGGDFRRVEQFDLEKCAASCSSSKRCKAYSFDKWNRTCFLKDRIGPLLLEPSSITGVRAGLQVERAISPPQFAKGANRGFSGKLLADMSVMNVESCEKLCAVEANCVTFSYRRIANQCQLYSSAGEYLLQRGFDSGVKRQMPK